MSPVPADDPALRLAVAFVNTYDLLDDPQDRLTVPVARTLADRHGFRALGAALRTRDLPALRDLRQQLYQVFAEPDAAAKTDALNAVLAGADARARLVADGAAVRLGAVGGPGPIESYGVTLADALARVLATGGADRLGTCVADPCRCGYVDRTRAGRQRYCCDLCNDRMAAAAYRRRS